MKFDEWFEAQHGKREHNSRAHVSDNALRDIVHAGQISEAELKRREMWDDMRRSALYAWQVRDGDKK